MRRGRRGDRELPFMSPVARRRFASLTDEEVHDLQGYLRALGAAASGKPGGE